MNPNRKLYGRITIGGTRSSLGYAEFSELMMRATHVYIKAKWSGNISVLLEVSQDQLPEQSIQSEEERLNNEFFSQMQPLDSESPYEGLTMGQIAEAMDSDEYKAYALVASHPEKRLGLTQRDLERLQLEYVQRFPLVAVHIPVWVD